MTVPELPEVYQQKTSDSMAKDLTIYIGLVFDGVLDGKLLEQKYREFVVRWPIVGGKLVINVRYKIHPLTHAFRVFVFFA